MHANHDQREIEDLEAHRGDLRDPGQDADQHEEEVETHRPQLHCAGGVPVERRMTQNQGEGREPQDRGDLREDRAQPLRNQDQDQAGREEAGDSHGREPLPARNRGGSW